MKNKLSEIKVGEIDNQRRKRSDFNQEQAEVISDRIIQKITTQVANHLKNSNNNPKETAGLIEQIFKLNPEHHE